MKRKITLLMLLLLTLAGCQTLRGLESPQIHLSGLQLADAGLLDQQWLVTLRVTNPNERSLTVTALDYVLYVEGDKMASGMTQHSITLPARDDTLVKTRVTTSVLSLLGKLGDLTRGGAAGLHYRVEGTAKVEGILLPLSFDHKGVVDELPL